MGISSRAIYCQILSSVQFDKGKTRMDSPVLILVLNRFQSSGRCSLGSHCPYLSRKEKTRSLARDFSSSRLAPPIAQSTAASPKVSTKAFVFSKAQHF